MPSIRRGHNLVELADPTAHAEMQTLTAAASTLEGKYLPGNPTLYVTVEPIHHVRQDPSGWAWVEPLSCGAPTTRRGTSGILKRRAVPSKTTIAFGCVLQEESQKRFIKRFFRGLRRIDLVKRFLYFCIRRISRKGCMN